MNQDHAYIHQEWHRAASTRDIPALIALYAHDAILESPLVPVIMDGKSDGVLRGKAEIERFLQAGARSRPIDLVRWHISSQIAATEPLPPSAVVNASELFITQTLYKGER
jgi:hypothetical protein